MPFEMCPRRVSRPCVVILSAFATSRRLLERCRLSHTLPSAYELRQLKDCQIDALKQHVDFTLQDLPTWYMGVLLALYWSVPSV